MRLSCKCAFCPTYSSMCYKESFNLAKKNCKIIIFKIAG